MLSNHNRDEIDMYELEANGKAENQNRSSYDASTSSPESASENAFSFNGLKFSSFEDKCGEKKVHWNPSQVHSLLDCIEKRIDDFRKKSVQKSVWLSIGKNMMEQGDFSVEHCYNKWKNLRRDVRLFNNSNNMQKLSIRNTYIMERVQKLVHEIGYENSPRKTSSPISLNNDIIDSFENAGLIQPSTGQPTDSWDSISCLKTEPFLKNSDKPIEDDFTHNESQKSHERIASIEESIISLLSDPAVSQTILMNPKLLEEILPGYDIALLLRKFVDAHPEMIRFHIPNPPPVTSNIHIHQTVNENFLRQQQFVNHNSRDLANSWQLQLFELLHSFREEESRQVQRLDQIVNFVQLMQESTKRRLSTINQLISLAGMLIPQR